MIHAILLLLCLSFAPSLRADDFNRPDVAYTHTASNLGWYWQASGASTWSLTDHEILVNNANPSLQEPEQTLYHTRVTLQSGDWSASVDVRGETPTRRAGLLFMVSGGGTNHYQIRLQLNTKQVQVLRRGSAGSLTIYTSDTSSSETFATTKYYTISAWSTVATQFNWNVKNPAGTVVASGSFTDASYTSGYAGIIKSIGDGNSDICHFDNFYVREITVPPITQPHPRLLLNSADVVEIKNAINAQVEPRYSAWLDLKSRADAWSNDPVGAPYTGRDSSVFFDRAKVAGGQAAKMALAYQLKGNAAHAAKAREILLAWAQATPLPGTDFDETIRFPNASMELARSINQFVFSYDYLHATLSAAERTVVENWFRAVLPTLQQGIDRWNTPFQRSTTDPRGWVESSNLDSIYFGGQLYQNHLVSHTMGYLLIGYAIGDQSLVQFAVDSPENPRDFLELFDGMILMAGDPFVAPADTMNPPPQDGEIVDRYRHVEDLGLYYGQLSLRQMMAMSETLFANGLDLYQRTGAYGETLEKPFDFYADFVRTGTSSIKGGFYTGEGFGAGGYKAAAYEVAHKRYPANLEVKALLDSVDRAAIDPSGDAETYFVYPTLTHGINAPPTISNVANQTVNEDTATSAIPFTVADDFTAAASLTLAKSSSNTALVPTANIVIGGSGASRTVTVTPAPNMNGTATITVTVSEGALTASDTFLLTVSAVNDAPTISNIAAQGIAVNTATGALSFTIADIETAATSLTLTKASSNPALIPLSAIVFGGSGAGRTVTVTPAANQLGSSTITVTVSDGTLTASDTFVVTVTGAPLETWRFANFGTTANTGNSADTFDANNDGEANLLEYATGQNPNTTSLVTLSAIRTASSVEITYPRSKAALTGGFTFAVEWSDTLATNSWSATGVTQTVLTDNGTVQTVNATIPSDSTIFRRYLHLKVTAP